MKNVLSTSSLSTLMMPQIKYGIVVNIPFFVVACFYFTFGSSSSSIETVNLQACLELQWWTDALFPFAMLAKCYSGRASLLEQMFMSCKGTGKYMS